jgi:oligosaccharide repeat unit polymerase
MPEIYMALAAVLCAVMLAYLLKGGMTLATCAGWVILTCVHGLLFKPMFVYFDFPSADVLDFVLFRRLSREEYWPWATVSLLAYVVLFGAMMITGRYRRPPERVQQSGTVQCFNNVALGIFLLLAVVGLGGFVVQFPQLLDSDSKNAIASSDLADYNGGGIWRSLAELAYLVSLCCLVNIGARVERRASIAMFVMSAGTWLGFCFLSDQRGAMLFSMATYLIAYNRYIGTVSGKSVFAAVCITGALVVFKTVSRLQAGGAALQESLAGTVGNFVGQNLIEHGKTITIIKSVPDVLSFQYGYTYLNAILVLVPRSLFPGKTSVNLDTTIGNAIYGCDAFGACGVPPGLLAESYLNFGVLGLVLMPFLMGLFIGKIDRTFRDGKRGVAFDMFYLISLLYLGMAIVGSGISSSITSVITQSISVLVVCYVAAKTVRRPRVLTVRQSWA